MSNVCSMTVEPDEFRIKSERIKNLGRLQRAAAFSLFPNLKNQEIMGMLGSKNAVRCDYKVYDLNSRVIFYVSSTTAISIAKDGPFCLKLMNKDQKAVAKFLRDKPRNSKKGGLVSYLGCCSNAKDEMEILDDVGNLLAKSFVIDDAVHGTEIVMRDPDGTIIMTIKSSKEHHDAFFAVGKNDSFLGEIRQKIISTGNPIDNYKGVGCWFAPNIPLESKLLFLAGAFLLEIDHFSESASRRVPIHQPETDYLNPIIKTPPYHERFRQNYNQKTVKKVKNTLVPVLTPKSLKDTKSLNLMPEIHHVKNFAPIGGEVESIETPSKVDKIVADEVKPTDPVKEMDFHGMNRDEFAIAGKKVLDYLVKQDENMEQTRCTPVVKPGYLKALISSRPPIKPDDIDEILEDYQKLIVPGLSQSAHPNFHSFYPSGNAYHCLLAELLGGHLGESGFAWNSNPALAELEVLIMDWLGEMMALPRELMLSPEGSKGGGCMQHSASESNLLVMMAARADMIRRMRDLYPAENATSILPRLVAYTSIEAHSSIMKATNVAMVKIRVLPTDENYSLRGSMLYSTIMIDREKGLIPFFVGATFGTTGPCSFDNLHELGQICRDYGIWLHVDAAYAGNALICPENRVFMNGIEWAESFTTTPSKLALAVCDVSCLWVRDRAKLKAVSLEADTNHLYKDLPTSRRFGALKMWFMIRSVGMENLQKQIREHLRLAEYMSKKLQTKKVKESNNFNKFLLYRLNTTGILSLASCTLGDKFVIRLCINTPKTTEQYLNSTFDMICKEVDYLRPFQEKIEQMTSDELEDFLKNGQNSKKSSESTRRLNVQHPSQTQSRMSLNSFKLDSKDSVMKVEKSDKSKEDLK